MKRPKREDFKPKSIKCFADVDIVAICKRAETDKSFEQRRMVVKGKRYLSTRKIDELYKEWSGKSHIENSCKDVHDSADCGDFARYVLSEFLNNVDLYSVMPCGDCSVKNAMCRSINCQWNECQQEHNEQLRIANVVKLFTVEDVIDELKENETLDDAISYFDNLTV